jgi:hypothetical protein
MRVLWIVALCACLGPAYRLNTRERYEVGEDPTIDVSIREPTKDNAVLIVTRPDGTTVRERVALTAKQNNVKFGRPLEPGIEPTFTLPGDYRVELRSDKAVLAQHEIRIAVDRLTKIFDDEEIADFALVAHYTRARANKQQRWKQYGALYENTLKKGVQINVVIEVPGDAKKEAWKPYEEEGTPAVMENNYVRFRERAGSVSASWISGDKIIAMRAATLADFERGFIKRFLQKYPSDLDANAH